MRNQRERTKAGFILAQPSECFCFLERWNGKLSPMRQFLKALRRGNWHPNLRPT